MKIIHEPLASINDMKKLRLEKKLYFHFYKIQFHLLFRTVFYFEHLIGFIFLIYQIGFILNS